jgi:hypothetical protein
LRIMVPARGYAATTTVRASTRVLLQEGSWAVVGCFCCLLAVWAVRYTFNTWPFAVHLGTGRHSGLGDIHQPLPHAPTAASEVGVVDEAALADGSALLPTATTAPSEGLTKKRRDSMRSAASHKAAEPSAPPSSARVVVRGDPCSGTTTAHLLCSFRGVVRVRGLEHLWMPAGAHWEPDGHCHSLLHHAPSPYPAHPDHRCRSLLGEQKPTSPSSRAFSRGHLALAR